jgi:uncharacterized protein YbjT (DUF2867 family)
MADRILVTGATGTVGHELVRRLRERGETVRAASRFPTAARDAFGEDVEIVEMDYDATDTWDAALQFVDRLFLMPPAFDPHAYATIRPFLDWAVSAGTRKVVLLSGMDVQNVPDLALHRLERHLPDLDIPYVILRPNLYMQNVSAGFLLDGIRQRGILELCAGEGEVSFVDERDVAAVAALTLCGAAHDGHALTLTGAEALDFHAVARVLSAAAGRPIRYADADEARMREILAEHRFAEGQADIALELFRSVRAGRRAAVHPDLSDALHRSPTSFTSFTVEHARVWR